MPIPAPIDFDDIRRRLATDSRTLKARARVKRVQDKISQYHQLTNRRRTGTVTGAVPDVLDVAYTKAQTALREASSAAFLRVRPRLDAARTRLIDDIAEKWGELNALQAALQTHEALAATVSPPRDRQSPVALTDGGLLLAGWLQRARPAIHNTAPVDDQRTILQQLGALLNGPDESDRETTFSA